MKFESKNLILGFALRTIMGPVLPNPKVVRKVPKKPGGDWNIKVSDDTLRDALYRHLCGEHKKHLADELGVTMAQFTKWVDGESRGKILREAENLLEHHAREYA